MKKALMVAGGWEGHQPAEFARIFQRELAGRGLECVIEFSLDVLADAERLKSFSLIFPCWTMGSLNEAQNQGLQAAVKGGVGLGGIHGGMGDAFRGNLDYEWMTGGHFVGHPYVGDYDVRVADGSHPITQGLPGTFSYNSEQYYLLVDPGLQVLADTEYLHEGRSCRMPVAWVKQWGRGRVFYSALGHQPDELERCPESKVLAVRGLLWAAGLL